MKSGQILPQELLSTIVSFTLTPWPAHYGMSYHAALVSRFKNPFLFVSRACRRTILDELADILWLELEWHGPLGDPDFLELFSTSNIPPTMNKGLSKDQPTVKVILTNPANVDTASVPVLHSVTAPFIYQDFAYIFDSALAYSYSIDLSKSHLTLRTSQYVEQLINPLLSFLMGGPDFGTPWNVRIYGEQIPHPGSSHFEHVRQGYHEYQRLRSSCLNAEARVFAIQASRTLNDLWVSRRDSLYEHGMFPNPTSMQNTVLSRIKSKKIMLEFTKTAASIATSLFHEDTVWLLERSAAFIPLISDNASQSTMYYGFPDDELAPWYYAIGLLDYTCAKHGKGRYVGAPDNYDPNWLAAASAICPENQVWKHDFENSIDFIRHHYGEKWMAEWNRRHRLRRMNYVDVDGVPRVWIGMDEGDWDAMTVERLRDLPVLQRFHKEAVEELERDLGIEHGDWQMS